MCVGGGTSDIKLVFHSSTITMMHGPINIRYTFYYLICKVIVTLLKYLKNKYLSYVSPFKAY